ncbi:McrB family protein [Aliarcobacter butzleri]|uniref:McrB family protein n=1 Tax=Aliarcobacter butzleri TaxID=28197 RepID=UPI0027D456E7|nr:AAA family ATPase [Aliarcobacter butzleri]
MNKNMNIVVMTHNPKGDWGDVRPQIEKDGYYKGWNKSISVEIGQTVLVYITADIGQIQYIMEVTNVEDKSIDLKLIRKLNENEMQQLSRVKLQENGLKQGTINYILNNNEQLYKYITNVLNNESLKKQENKDMKTKNIMLYGAPGVGKTHNYKRLITMIENGESEKTIFDTISKNETTNDFDNSIFETIKNEKRIEFVTFHQSYSYEDFIEGFRPNENGDIELDKKGGVFKRIADKARENLLNSKKSKEELKNEKNILDKFQEYVSDKIEKNEKLKLQRGEEFYFIKFEDNKLYFSASEKSNANREFILKYEDFLSIHNALLNEKKTITIQKISEILDKNSTQQKYAYYLQIWEDFKIKYKSNPTHNIENIDSDKKNFYIVIDEINRGNISKIFGELITLIEEDKRDAYEVTLPYSKEKFKIPSNLYIIATMNSTDKSIATIDIALRRRFTFLKMKPKEELVKNENAKALMNELNNHISKNISEDYALGHSYFMNIKDDNDLEFVKKYKIKPLLEEYFYGDETNYNKVIEILNRKDNE